MMCMTRSKVSRNPSRFDFCKLKLCVVVHELRLYYYVSFRGISDHSYPKNLSQTVAVFKNTSF